MWQSKSMLFDETHLSSKNVFLLFLVLTVWTFGSSFFMFNWSNKGLSVWNKKRPIWYKMTLLTVQIVLSVESEKKIGFTFEIVTSTWSWMYGMNCDVYKTTKLLSQKRCHLAFFCISFIWPKGNHPEKKYYLKKCHSLSSVFFYQCYDECYDFIWIVICLRSIQTISQIQQDIAK